MITSRFVTGAELMMSNGFGISARSGPGEWVLISLRCRIACCASDRTQKEFTDPGVHTTTAAQQASS